MPASVDFAPLTPKIVLGVAAHPDDLDFGAGGTMAAFAAQGAAIHYLQVTDGCKGSSENLTPEVITEMRQREQQAACKIIGGQSVHFLDYCDGELEVSMKLKADIVEKIRQLKPDVVITTDPTEVYAAATGMINHSDHRAAGQAALDAVYPLARDHLSFPKLVEEGLAPHKVKTVLLINSDNHNYYCDISESFDTKLKALRCHASQIGDVKALIEKLTTRATDAGQTAGVKYAEGFMRLDLPL